MDNKYQDLQIYNLKNHNTSVIREIEIKQIIFNETEIVIDYIYNGIAITMILPKLNNIITID